MTASSNPSPSTNRLLFELDERPPWPQALLATAAHLLAVVGGIAAAPLLIATGLGLDVATTNYIIGAAFMVSGVATFIQVKTFSIGAFGPIGSGLLSVQGTSFAFIGAMMFAGSSLDASLLSDIERVGVLLGSAAVGAGVTVVAGFFIQHLSRIVTPTVTGIAIFLLGLSLMSAAWTNLGFALQAAEAAGGSAAGVWIQVAIVVVVVLGCALQGNPWLRLSSITLGLLAGLVYSAMTGALVVVDTQELPLFQILQPTPFPLGFDLGVCLILLPIFFVTMTESLGDLTATSMLSNLKTTGASYWRRVRGGVMADGLNSVLAALLGTFPNTTFSQNNAVIQLTGVASRFVGILLAIALLLLGMLPAFGAVFQRLPGGVLHGTTGILFTMIALVGVRMLAGLPDRKRTLRMAAVCTLGAFLCTQIEAVLAPIGIALPTYLSMLLNFPVATGVLIGVFWELIAMQFEKGKSHDSC